jgi:hypothetical protein
MRNLLPSSCIFFFATLVLTFCLVNDSGHAVAQQAPLVQNGIGAHHFASPTEGVHVVKLSEKAKQHPDFGTVFLPDSTGKDQLDFVELTDQRTEYSATFHNFSTNTSCIRQSGDVPLHYKDEAGLWRNVQEKLLPTAVNGVYDMPKLKFPISFDSRDGSSSIRFGRSGAAIGLGKNIRAVQLAQGGTVVAEEYANPQRSAVTEREALLTDIVGQVDFACTFGLEGVKTSYLIKDRSFVLANSQVVVFEEEISLPLGWVLAQNEENGQMTEFGWQGELVVKDQSGKVQARIMPASVFDNADHTADFNIDEHSTIGAFRLQRLPNNRFKLQLAVPTAWLRNPAVKYPVTVDPVVVVDNYTALGVSSFSACNYALSATLPGTVIVNNTRNYWTIQTQNNGWTNEQRTRIIGPSGTTATYNGCCSSGGNQVYDLTSNIGNGTFTNTTTYTYSAWNTWQNVGCVTTYQYFSRRYMEVYYCAVIDDGSITANGSTGTINICLGSSVTIASVGGNTGSWCYWISSNGGASWNIEAGSRCNQGSFSYTPNAVGTWTFHKRHSDDCGYCWDAGRSCTCNNCLVYVNVQAPPSAPSGITGTTTICSGSSTTLTANGGDNGSGATFQWGTGSTVGSNIIGGATGVSYTTPALTSNTTYWVRRVGNTACTAATGGAIQTVIVNPLSIAPSGITGTTSICGGSTTLTATGGMIAYYPFSSNLNDASGNGLHLSGSGGSFTGGGLQLTTSSGYTSPSTAALNTDKYTISFDMQFTANPDGSWRRIFGFQSGGSDRSPGLWKFPSTMNMHWRHDPGNTGIDESFVYNLNQWYNVTGVKDGATFTVYVNGVQVATGAVANPKSAGMASFDFGGAPVLLKEFRIYNGVVRWFSGSCGGTTVGFGPTVTVSPPVGTTNYFVRVEGSCNTTTCASVGVTNSAAPTANAGSNVSQCGTAAFTIPGTPAGGTYSSVSWAASGLVGTGSFTSATNITNPTFTPTSASGSVTLTITVFGSGACAGTNPTSSMTFSWVSAPSANAGPATFDQCGTGNVMFLGASASSPGSWSWSLLGGGTGTGNLINGGGSITAWGFQPTSSSGSRTVRLSNTGSGGCGSTTVTDDMVITWSQVPSVSVTSPLNSCTGSSAFTITGANPAGTYSALTWSLTPSVGTGSITANGGTASPTFTPTSTSGQFTMTLQATGSGVCAGNNPSAAVVVNWAPAPIISSNGGSTATCGSAPHPMTGATVSGTFGSVAWTGGGGLGSWSNTSTTNPALWTFTPSSSVAGSFNATITVFGSGTCAGTNASTIRNVSWSTPPSASAGATINSCTGTGAITMTGASSASGTYNWSTFSGTAGTWIQAGSASASTFTPSASPGSIVARLTVTGTGACSAATQTSDRTVNWFTPPTISAVSVTNVTSCTTNNGVISVNASGVGPLSYSINNGATYGSEFLFDDLAPGTYNIIVRDANNCTRSFTGNPVTISPVATVTVSSVTVTQNVTCGGGNNGAITINGISGGTPNYEYTLSGPTSDRWSDITTTPNFVINNLPAGSYQVVVRDRYGCMSATYNVTITQPTPISITAVSVTDIVGCGGSGTGAISVTASGGTGALNYYRNSVINSPATSGSFTGLTAGLYEIEVRDASSCSQIATARISAPWVPTAGSDIQICSGQSVQLQGGIIGQFPTSCEQVCTSSCAAPTTYCAVSASNTTDEWISGVVFSGISNSGNPSTNYTNNTGTATIVYRNSVYPLSVTVSQCGGCGFTEYVTAFFDWNRNGVFESGEVYNIGATAGNPGTVTQNITIPAGATLGTTRMRLYMNFSSYPDASGCLSTVYGEIEDYSIDIRGNQPCVPSVSWSSGLGSSYTPTVSPTANTTYTLTINDGAGCTQTSNVNVRVSNISTSNFQQNVSCSGEDDACLLLQATGGIMPNLQKLSNGQFMVIGGRRRAITVNSAAALTNHQVSINVPYAAPMRSDFGDIRFYDNNLTPIPYWVESYTLSGTAKVWLKIPSLAAGANTVHLVYGNSSLTTASNGNAVFEFFDDFDAFNASKWTQGVIAATGGTNWTYFGGRLLGGNTNRTQTSVPVFNGNLILESRVYETVAVPNGFTSSGFHENTGNVLSILSHAGTTFCRNDAAWPNFGAFTSVNQWTRDFIQATGASSFVSRTGETSGSVSASYSNSGLSNEGIRLGARGDNSATDQNFGAQWDWIFVRKFAVSQPTVSVGGVEAFNEAFCGLAPGPYTINLVDAAGCTRTQNFTVTQPNALAVTQNNYSVICPGASNGSIDIDVTGGTPAYSYIWAGPSSFSATTQDVSSRPAGAYNVTTADNNGCTQTRTYDIYNYPTIPAVPTPSASPTTICNGSTTALTAAGLAPGGQVANFTGTQTTSASLLTGASNSFTMELWVNPTASRPTTAEQNGLGDVSGTSNQRYAIFAANGGANAGAGISVGTNGISVFEHGSGYMPSLLVWDAPISGWTHVAVVYNNRTPSLYVNGNLVKVGLTSQKTTINPSVGTGDAYGYYAGALDNVRIWSTSRTLAQIQADMYREDPTVATGLIAHYKYTGNTNASVGTNLTNGGTTFTNANHFTYTWSGTGAPAASTAQTQTTAALSTGTINYTVTATASGCAGTTSATVPVTVNPGHTVTAGANRTVCINTAMSPSITMTLGGGATGATVTPLPAGVTASVSGTTLTIAGTPTASGTFNYNVTTTGNACAAATTSGTITVRPVFTAGAINTTGETICNGGNPGVIGSTTAASGGDGTITYEWRANGVPIASTNSATYDPPSGLGSTTVYTRWARDGSCNTTFTQSTGTWTVTVQPVLAAGTIGTSQSICFNTAPTGLTETGAPSGGTGSYTYQWQRWNGSSWVDISLATSATFSPGSLTATEQYRRNVTSGTCGTVSSNEVTITVLNAISALTVNNNGPVCLGSPLSLSVGTVTGATYSWTGPNSFASTAQNPTVSASATSAMAGVYTVVATVSGCPSPSGTTTVTVSSNNTASAASAAPTLCINTPLTAITHTTTGATGISNNGVAGANGLPGGVSATWASNTITISGTPTASGPFNYSIPLIGGCGSVNATGTITVTPNNTIAAGVNRTTCINTAMTTISLATTGATGATFSGLPAGVNGSWAANTVTISGTPTASGTFNYTVTTTGGCTTPAVTATGTITVTANNTIAAGINRTTCINTAMTTISLATTGATGATFSGLPAGVNGSWAANTVTISGTPTASGTFNYTVTTTGGCTTPAVTATGTITVTANNTIAAGINRTTCINTAITSISLATTGATGATFSGLPAGVNGSWAANTVTISGAPTASGTFNYTVTTTGGCTTPAVTATGTITVTANNTVSIASSTPTLCINTGLTAITHTTTGATGISNNGVAGANGLPAGVSASWAANTITISGTPSAAGPFNYSIPLTGGCGNINATGTITVTTSNTASAGSSSPTLCINTLMTPITHTTTGAVGIGAATGLPAGVTASWASNTITISGTPSASGPFNYSIPLTGGCGSVNATGNITVTPSVAASVSISASSSTICPGTNVTFTATPTNGGASPTYQWRVGATPVGTNSPSYSNNSLVNGNVVTVVMTSNAACPTGSPATSNGITMTVLSPATPVASVTAQPTCATPGGTITISSPLGATYEYALNGGTYQSSPVFNGLAPGSYSATSRLAASPACVSPSGPSLTINTTPSAIPAMTPVIVCQGGSGSLVSNNNCVDNFVAPFPANTIYSGWLASGSPTAAVTSGAVNTATCAFGGPVRTYSTVPFQVSITGDYIFEMNANAAYNGAGYIVTGNFTPGSCATGTLVRADNSSGTDGEPRLGGAGGAGNMSLTAGVTYTLVSTTDGGADVTGNTYTWTITPPSGGDVLLNSPGSVQWYTASSGGSPIFTGETFNPVGVVGSGLSNTNSSGTWTYYAACSSSPSCRTAATFQVTTTTTIYNVTPASTTCYNPTTPITVSLSGSINGMPYRLMRDGAYTGTEVMGNGSGITIGNTSIAGAYTVVAYISGSCMIPMNGTVNIQPAPIANAGADVTLCGASIGLTGSSNNTTLATENFGSANTELTNTTSGWRVRYLFGTHPGNRTRWYISGSGASPFNFSCATSGSALVLIDDRLPFQSAVPCDYAWDNGVMDEIAYNTAPIDARLYTSVNVSFTYRIGGNYSAPRNPQVTDYMQVMYSLDNGATWVAVNAGNNGGSYTLRSALNGTTNAFFSLTGTTQTGTANVTMPSAVTGTHFLLGFRWTNDGSMAGDYVDNMLVDNIVVTGAASYSWSPTTGVTGANTATPTVTVPTTYTVTVTGGNGCTATDDVVVRPRPQVNNITGTTVCSGTAFNVAPVNGTDGVVPAGTTYTWSAPSVAGITGAASGTNASNISGTLTNTTNAPINVTYAVTPTGNGCTSTPFNVTVTVNPRPAVTNMTASTCSGTAFTITPVNSTNGIVPVGTTYGWGVPTVTGGLTGGSTGTGQASISGTLTNPTNTAQTATYLVTATGPNCAATGTFTVTVTVNPIPSMNNLTASACSNAAFSVTPVNVTNGTVPAGTTYSWSVAPTVTGGMTGGTTGSGAASIGGTLVNPTTSNQTATYTVTPSVSGCSGAQFTVVATINPSVTVPGAITVSGTEPTCQLTSSGSTTDYNSSITVGTQQWSLTGITNTNGTITAGAINSTNGIVTWPNGWSGSVTVNVVSTGCNGPSAATTRTVTVLPTVGSATAPTVVSGTEPLCQLTNGTTTTGYGSTASNNTGFNWSISNGSAGSINATTGVMTWANGFSGSVNIQVTANGCSGPSAQASRTVTISPTVTVPTAITLTGTEPTCQLTSAGNTTDYNSTVTTGTLQWSLTSITNTTGTILGSAINATTGVVTWPNGWSGSVTVNVVSTGCNGPSTAVTRVVNVTPTVATPSVPTIISGSEPPCQLTNGTTTTGYGSTAANNTGFNWSISNPAAGSINATTGVMTWANNFAGSVNIQVTANGCNGPSAQVVRPVTVSPTVGTPTAITVSAGTEPICQLMNGTTTTTYSSSATNSTALNWSISNPAAGTINSAGVLTWTNGFYGTVQIRVTASGCNGPSAQVTRTVSVGIGVLNSGFRTWTGLVNTLWEVPGNWDCGGVPTSADRVIIPAAPIGGNKPVINNGIVGYCLDIELQGNTMDLLTIPNGGLLNVGP